MAHIAGRTRGRIRWVVIVLALIIVGGAVWNCDDRYGRRYVEPKASHEGSSATLSRTVVLPTLDEPLPANKNAVWCASFQMAWDHLGSDVIKQPPRVKGAEALCDRLGRAPFGANNLRDDSFYATAGFVKDGIVETITRTMKSRFPSAPAPELTSEPEGIVAYAYLSANVKFKIPFFDNRGPLAFRDSSNAETPVASFGIRAEDDYAFERLRKQVEVLYADFDQESYKDGYHKAEYAVDPCKDSTPYQIVLARVERQDTLAATLRRLEQKIAEFPKDPYRRELGPNEILLVPSQSWRIDHHFTQLEGEDKVLQNPGFKTYYVAEALQAIEFKLDRGGAELRSEAKQFCAPIPRYFIFDRPFLIYMKMRGEEKPFLVMWVENSELLSPFAQSAGESPEGA